MEQLQTSPVLSSFFAFPLLNSLVIEKKRRTHGNASFINYLVIEGKIHTHTQNTALKTKQTPAADSGLFDGDPSKESRA